MTDTHDTLSVAEVERENPGGRTGEHPGLIRLVEFDHPLEGSSCHSLAGIEQCEIGRAKRRSASREDKRLQLGVIDARVSARHAVLRSSLTGWEVEDSGSKNGVEVNGTRVRYAILENGDLVRLGNTVFLFTDNLPVAPGADLADAELPSPLPGLRSLNHEHARLLRAIAKVAATDLEILVSGETGTGKEVVANAIHELSGRAGRFVAINCGAVSPSLIEGQLFGWRRGAFSGAVADSEGLVRSASGGTLFLDEIGDLPLAQQTVLLRTLQEHSVVPIGSSRPVEVDFRLITATHRDLHKMVREGLFREDLLARISGFHAELPALRDRKEDLGMLIATLLSRTVRDSDPEPNFSPRAARKIIAWSWPQNIRELDKCLSSAVALANGDAVEVSHLPSAVQAGVATDLTPPNRSERRPLEGASRCAATRKSEKPNQRGLLLDLLRQYEGNLAAVARNMGTSRSQVRRLLRRFALDPNDYR